MTNPALNNSLNQTTASNDPAVRPMATPATLKAQLPLPEKHQVQVEQHRQQIRNIMNGDDKRLLVITGPCSIHDEEAALDYGQRLAALNRQLGDRLMIVMRAYVEKPRTNIGWKGLAYDPQRDGKGDMAAGIERSRKVMLELIRMGLPLATEALNPMVMMYLDDLVSWTAIGARTAESQIHREMVSHLGMPTGIKNGTDGSMTTAVNAMVAARHSHHTLGVDCHGQLAMLTTPGNPDTHIVLRGGNGITNYDAASIAEAQRQLQDAGCNAGVLVDCSHANACKQHRRQIPIALEVVEQRVAGNDKIIGVMLESFINEGSQKMDGKLVYGQSITDPCIGWDQTETLLQAMHSKLV
ncbi:3-deoxy-7-phosphoheptulonate synthase [Oceanobacter mangrovi]|uniref:3-deoxy-7-phosphoheptulonate synthase n=1 Tax=Oceanobacter mangrovi TaxID=2862510 RepID=UPI001C8D2A23|nr:3-deoxy-7-phosphoheptulonate synthase [Oceanobacter mangrovi]